jgi:hypothetical protein
LRAREAEGVYLGEVAERRLEIGDVPIVAYELNPRGAPRSAGEMVDVHVDPADIVLLPGED